MRKLWPRWTLLPGAPWILWCLYRFAHGVVRWDLILVFLLALTLPYINEKSKKLLIGAYPALLVGVLYDSMYLTEHLGLTKTNIHDCDLRAHELKWFGITYHGMHMTLQDWFQAHSSPVLDVICSIPYGTFIYIIFGYAVYLFFRDFTGLKRFAWSFLLLNVFGFITYHIYPAAPPWYFHTHGCHVDLAAHASEGPNLARVDKMLGFRYFHGLYGRSNDVYGAIPSLHVAYPLLIVLEGYRHHRWPVWSAMIAFFLLMCFSAVYLDHHWVIDVLLGLLYCVVIYSAVSLLFRRLERRRGSDEPATDRVPAQET